MDNNKEMIEGLVSQILDDYHDDKIINQQALFSQPDKEAVCDLLSKLIKIMYPGYFKGTSFRYYNLDSQIAVLLEDIMYNLRKQVVLALPQNPKYRSLSHHELVNMSEKISNDFFKRIPKIRALVETDVAAFFDGDPAAKSKEEIIFSYPGLFAIYVYRLAHVLYKEEIPFIPRVMSEYAHGRTGIDINPGATIGEYFFIDHGTGVVVGETTEIGNNVKLYQGVTLGALSTRMGQQLANVKRHPTIRDNVTIYSNSTVLGGETVVGENTIIGGNTFITESIPANTKVSAKSPELVIKKPKSQVSATNVWDY